MTTSNNNLIILCMLFQSFSISWNVSIHPFMINNHISYEIYPYQKKVLLTVGFPDIAQSPFHVYLCTHICGHQLLCVIDALHSDFTLTDERVVIWIGGYQQHLWNEAQKVLISLWGVRAVFLYKIKHWYHIIRFKLV